MHRFTSQRVCNPYCGHAMLSWILCIAFISWSGNNFLRMQIHEKFHYRTGGNSIKSEISTNNLHEFLTLTKPFVGNTTHKLHNSITLTGNWNWLHSPHFCCIKWAVNSGVVQETIVGHVHIHVLQVHMYHYTTYSLHVCARVLQQLPVKYISSS